MLNQRMPKCSLCKGDLEPKMEAVPITQEKLRQEGYSSTEFWECKVCKTVYRRKGHEFYSIS